MWRDNLFMGDNTCDDSLTVVHVCVFDLRIVFCPFRCLSFVLFVVSFSLSGPTVLKVGFKNFLVWPALRCSGVGTIWMNCSTYAFSRSVAAHTPCSPALEAARRRPATPCPSTLNRKPPFFVVGAPCAVSIRSPWNAGTSWCRGS